MKPVKLIVAHNLAELRKAKHLTQGELAEQFNYTDKSVSKWEHGDTMPDIEVLKQLCDFYGVTLDYLVSEDHDDPSQFLENTNQRVANKWTIAALSALCVWLVALVLYFALQIASQGEWVDRIWVTYLWAVPAMFIVLIVFNGLWGKPLWRTILVIFLTWSSLTALYITLGLFLPDNKGWELWELFLIGVPLTIAAILWNHVLSTPKKKN